MTLTAPQSLYRQLASYRRALLVVLLCFFVGRELCVAQSFAYVTNFISNTVSVIDTNTDTVKATIPVGAQPFGVAVSPTGTRVYVTNRTSGNVSVIDTSTNTVIATIPVGAAPLGIAVNPQGTRVYVANGGTALYQSSIPLLIP